jgi:hypothetical protein
MTIKTQGGKVITKDGKVSCECCVEGCFIYELYPAANYEAGYNFEDLPDEVVALDIVSGGPSLGNITLSKTLGSINGVDFFYQADDPSNPESGFIIKITGVLEFSNWELAYYAGVELVQSSGTFGFLDSVDSNSGRCIPSFANSYTINGPSGNILVLRTVEPDPTFPDGTLISPCNFWCEKEFGPRPINVLNPCAIFRRNPGLWIGSGASLYFDYVQSYSSEDEFTVVGDSFKWTIKTSAGTFQKIGDQNTPVGSYAEGFTVS